MNPDTGAIAHFEIEEDAKNAGFTEPLTQSEAETLISMNRHQRRAELSRMRKAIKSKTKLLKKYKSKLTEEVGE